MQVWNHAHSDHRGREDDGPELKYLSEPDLKQRFKAGRLQVGADLTMERVLGSVCHVAPVQGRR